MDLIGYSTVQWYHLHLLSSKTAKPKWKTKEACIRNKHMGQGWPVLTWQTQKSGPQHVFLSPRCCFVLFPFCILHNEQSKCLFMGHQEKNSPGPTWHTPYTSRQVWHWYVGQSQHLPERYQKTQAENQLSDCYQDTVVLDLVRLGIIKKKKGYTS